ncbi:VWA domain-containing protein [Pseudomonas sp. HR96]|uniref:vWA domain-containing protein n=1 Tax=Pseudomonas sp. HR96 TaxID=1027966 RepID=UPI002A752DFA|nr:VWA domain-containing protein [Pseudomonas sp. HR96]WPO97907.1 VWA domain-containing protein [Pseudomonas sp. HR96]
MGRTAAADSGPGAPSRSAELAKKALSIRPPAAPGADARPRSGELTGGNQGRSAAAGQGRIDWLATLFGGRPQARTDLRWQQRRAAPQELWLVIVDASASTRRHGALAEAKGVLAQLFDQAYRQRARLALLTASGERPGWQCHGLKASKGLQQWLRELGAGGGTPLLAALEQARGWLRRRRRQLPAEAQRCLVLTDGRLKELQSLHPLGCPTLLIDIEKGPIRLGRARQLALQLGAEYVPVGELPAAPGQAGTAVFQEGMALQ